MFSAVLGGFCDSCAKKAVPR